MKKIEKKTWPEAFEKILSGEKTFDARLANFDCTEILVSGRHQQTRPANNRV